MPFSEQPPGSQVFWPTEGVQFVGCQIIGRCSALQVMNLDPLASYVKQREGRRVIRKILISNNGMAAVKAPGVNSQAEVALTFV